MKEASSERVSKRFAITQETFKMLKIKAIELELDVDGKSTPEALGDVILSLFKEIETLKLDLKSMEQKRMLSEKDI